MANSPLVQTYYGLLQGCWEEGAQAFHGIPYAQPPVGNRRFRAPIPADRWDGIRDASRSRPAAYQVNSENMERVIALTKELWPKELPGLVPGPPYVFKTYDQKVISEDCLYLDIWRPANLDSSKHRLPVYVYYHGGANIVSSGSFHPERGTNLARVENIIVVRPNYRMGALGWVHFGLVSDQFPEAVNLGLQDQIAALK